MLPVRACLTSFLAALLLAGTAAAEDWPQFRGPNGLGISKDPRIPLEWSASKNLKWKLNLPGKGFSSPIVVGDKVFVTYYEGGSSGPRDVVRHLFCVNRKTGKILWDRPVPAVQPEFNSRGGFAYHGYASSTPASDGERVYCFFGTTGLLAFDFKGEKLWQKSLGTELRSMFGTASSPIVYKDLVIVPAGSESQTIYAFERKTGKEVWKAPGAPLSGSYSTPAIVKNKDGEDELLISVPMEVWALNPTTGKLKWYASTQVDTAACPNLITDGQVVYALGGRSGGRTALKIGGKGDVTRANVVWSKRGGPYVASPVLHEGKLFYFPQTGAAICVDAKTGDELGRARLRGGFYASPTLINGKIYAVSRTDGVYVLEPTKDMKIIAHNTLGDSSDFSGSPAVSDGQLFLRSERALYCISAE